MLCKKCGSELFEGEEVCFRCGAIVDGVSENEMEGVGAYHGSQALMQELIQVQIPSISSLKSLESAQISQKERKEAKKKMRKKYALVASAAVVLFGVYYAYNEAVKDPAAEKKQAYEVILSAIDVQDTMTIFEYYPVLSSEQKAEIRSKLINYAYVLRDQYVQETASYENVLYQLQSMQDKIFVSESTGIMDIIDTVSEIKKSRDAYAMAQIYVSYKDYGKALESYASISSIDTVYYKVAMLDYEATANSYREEMVAKAKEYQGIEDYNSAIEVIKEALYTLPNDPELLELLDEENGYLGVSENEEEYENALLTNMKMAEVASMMQTKQIWIDGSTLSGDGSSVENGFTIKDIDSDGKPELVMRYKAGSTAETMRFGIYEYNTQEQSFVPEVDICYANTTFYTSNTFIAQDETETSYGNVSPYYVFSYNAESNTYEMKYYVVYWDKTFRDANVSGTPYPDSVDADHDNVIYLITDFTQPEMEQIYLDNQGYEEWFSNIAPEEDHVRLVEPTDKNIEVYVGPYVQNMLNHILAGESEGSSDVGIQYMKGYLSGLDTEGNLNSLKDALSSDAITFETNDNGHYIGSYQGNRVLQLRQDGEVQYQSLSVPGLYSFGMTPGMKLIDAVAKLQTNGMKRYEESENANYFVSGNAAGSVSVQLETDGDVVSKIIVRPFKAF